MAGMTKKAQGSVQELVWVGDLDALRQLVKQVEELANYIREKLTAVADASREDRKQEEFDKWTFVDEHERERRWQAADADHHKRIKQETTLHMVVELKRWSMKLMGKPEEVLDEIDDVKDVESVTITLSGGAYPDRGGYNLAVSLGRAGATAAAWSPEPSFIDLASARLRDQFRLQRPWYWWFRANSAIWATAVPGGIAGTILSGWLLRATDSVIVTITSQLFFIALFIWGGWLLMRRVAVPFELLKEGTKGRTTRSLQLMAGAGVWVIGTILIPILLSVLIPTA